MTETTRTDIRSLQPLVGTWTVTGDSTGTVTYEWMRGERFLMQHVDLESADGTTTRGLEIIGPLQLFGQEPSADLHSRYYGEDGSTLDYVYELDGRALTIWSVEKGSPAFFTGEFSDDLRTNTGAWVWPGGGYSTTMTRAD